MLADDQIVSCHLVGQADAARGVVYLPARCKTDAMRLLSKKRKEPR